MTAEVEVESLETRAVRIDDRRDLVARDVEELERESKKARAPHRAEPNAMRVNAEALDIPELPVNRIEAREIRGGHLARVERERVHGLRQTELRERCDHTAILVVCNE